MHITIAELFIQYPVGASIGLILFLIIVVKALRKKNTTVPALGSDKDAPRAAAGTVVQSTASVIPAVIAAAVAEYRKNEEGVKNV